MIGGAAYWAQQRGKKTVLAGMCPTDPNWLAMMCKRGIMQYIGVVGVHGFPGTWEFDWEGWSVNLAKVQAVLDRHAAKAQLWITETGFSTWRHDERGQFQAFVDAMAAPTARIYWYSVHNLHPDLPHQDGFHADERHYHFGLTRADGAPKLLFRLGASGGLQSVCDTAWLKTSAPLRRDKRRPALITGGVGFIGTNLADRLLTSGRPVLVFDNLSRPGVDQNLRWLRERHGDRVQIEVADVRDRYALREAARSGHQFAGAYRPDRRVARRTACSPLRGLAPWRSALLCFGYAEIPRRDGMDAEGRRPPRAQNALSVADAVPGPIYGLFCRGKGGFMRYALVNPCWSFEGSVYFGCREPHLPLEYGYAKSLLERQGHDVLIVDGQLEGLCRGEITARVAAFQPDFTVVTTAPSYLFWRCAPPELRVPQETVRDLAGLGGTLVAIGPHGSTTPRTTLRKLGVDVVVQGEAEEILPQLAGKTRAEWRDIPALCYLQEGEPRIQGEPHASDMAALPALEWPGYMIWRHQHHHHRFDVPPWGPGAEVETSRGCPYHGSFCAKENFRDRYRRRPLAVILAEIDGLIAQGVEYVYFIDEIFLPNAELLEALAAREVIFGIQTRIDLWSAAMLDLLGHAGCVSVEAGVESITPEGRQSLDKQCKLSTEDLAERLISAKKSIPFVQANLLDAKVDEPRALETWRRHLQRYGVWANAPVPLFPYPGSPDYTKKWGLPDDQAWERAHAYYLAQYAAFSDIQEAQPLPLHRLELTRQE